MNKLEAHLTDENFPNIMKLHPHPFGEILRFMYQILRIAASKEADTLIFTDLHVEIWKDNQLVRQVDTGSLESLANTTFRKRFQQVLKQDKVVAAHTEIITETDAKMVCAIKYE